MTKHVLILACKEPSVGLFCGQGGAPDPPISVAPRVVNEWTNIIDRLTRLRVKGGTNSRNWEACTHGGPRECHRHLAYCFVRLQFPAFEF